MSVFPFCGPFVAQKARRPENKASAVAIKHGDIDAAVEIAVLEADPVGLVEQVGIEDHRPVGAIGNGDRLGPGAVPEIRGWPRHRGYI